MEFELACATWIREEDEQVLKLLREADRWLTSEELSEKTGLPPARVESTLRRLGKQIKMADARKHFLQDLGKDE